MGALTTLEQDAYDADQYRAIIGASQENRLQLRKASKEARAAVAELVRVAGNAERIIRNCTNAGQLDAGYMQHADELRAALVQLRDQLGGE